MFSGEDPLDVIAAQLDRLAGEDRSGWNGPAQSERAVGLLQLHGRLEAEAARAAGDWHASGAWQADGSRHPTAALARRSGRSPAVCRRVLRIGKLGRDHELTGKALGSGDLPIDHAWALANAIGDRDELYPDYEQDLIGPASRLDHTRYRRLLEAWKHLADDLLGRDREGEAFEQRTFSISQLLDGLSAIDGTADAEGAAIIRSALDAYTVLDPADLPGERRTAGQVRFDALIAALAASINGATPGRPRRSTDIIVTYQTLLGLPPTDLEGARCEIVGVGPVAPSLLRRLAADSALGRIIATAGGLPLDVGAQVRAFPRAHRRAIRFRDDTCVWPGCGLPGEWSEIDHVIEHHRGGTTSVANGRFLCVRHHHKRHQGWTVAHDPATGRSQVTSPDGTTYTNDPDPPPSGRSP